MIFFHVFFFHVIFFHVIFFHAISFHGSLLAQRQHLLDNVIYPLLPDTQPLPRLPNLSDGQVVEAH